MTDEKNAAGLLQSDPAAAQKNYPHYLTSGILRQANSGKSIVSDCPVCGYKGAFSITRQHGKTLFFCHAGCTQQDLLDVIPGASHVRPSTSDVSAHRPKDQTQLRRYIETLWEQSREGHPLLAAYLVSRGIQGPIPTSLRLMPKFWHHPSRGRWPCMIAAVTDADGRLQAIHRTYLALDGKGKAPIKPSKMTLGPVGGMACHLADATGELIVTEGIETGLSVWLATGQPVWAALSAGGIRNLTLPPLPLAGEVIIAADADDVGMRAAQQAANLWREQGRRVRIAMPPAGTDFNDILKKAEA